nr:hypothetical protein [Tanacetum cinerariifolium]
PVNASIDVTSGRLYVLFEHHVHDDSIVRTRCTTDRITVPISTVFDRFWSLKMPEIQPNSVADTCASRAVDCQPPLMAVNHTYLCLDMLDIRK